MKITKEDYTRLESLINKYNITPEHAQQYKDKGYSKMRFLWDVFHHITDKSQRISQEDYIFLRGLYDYLNDDHITTALNKILKY